MRARMIICRSRFPHRNCLRVSERCCEGVTTMYRIYVNLETHSNRSTYELQCEDKKTALSGREFQIMEMLMDRPNFIIPIDDFMSHVWGWESDVDVSVIWVHISNIRKKLASMKANVEIRFIRGAGYKLEEANDL